jgi:HD superfamily phosphohydrolase
VLRDARNHSFEFAAYDLARLLDNIVLAERDRNFVLAVRPPGLSAVESFIVARYRSYQYGVRHHKVAQLGTALRFSIARTLAHSLDRDQVDQFIRDVGDIAGAIASDDAAARALLDRFASYDDVWWISIMRAFAAASPDEWINLVCWREAGPRSLWKRIGDFPVEIRSWNERLAPDSDLDAMSRWAEKESELRRRGVLVIRHDFSPWRAATGNPARSAISVLQRGGSLTSVTDLSPVVLALKDAWMGDVQVHAFATSTCTMSPLDVITTLSSAMGGG